MVAATSNQALTLIAISALLLSTLAVEAHDPVLAPASAPRKHESSSSPSPIPTPASYKSASKSFTASSSPSLAPTSYSYISSSASAPLPFPSEPLVPYDVKAQMTMYVEGNMQVTMQKIEEFAQALVKRLEDPETSAATKECIQQCDEVYESAKDDIKHSIEDIKSGNLYKANFDISSISTNVDTCEQCFDEMVGEDPELKKFDDWVRGITDDCMGALDKVTS